MGAAVSADMRKASNKSLARELALHGSLTLARLTIADLRRRIRLARKMLLVAHDHDPIITGTTAWRLLDLRRPLPRTRKAVRT